MSYGMSTEEGKNLICATLHNMLSDGAAILDIGAGGATYYNLLGPNYDWTAIEIWPEAAEFCRARYNRVLQIDMRQYDWDKDYDLVIFGDVLEHVSVEDAQKLIKKAKAHSNMILIAIPYCYKQEALYGNEAEKHIQDKLTVELFDALYPGFNPIKIFWQDGRPAHGYYFWRKED